MSKFYPIKVWHLEQEDFYTPNGNRPHITTDGFFGGQVVYEPKTKKVYRVCLVEEKDVSDEFIEKCEFEIRVERLQSSINKHNIDLVEQVINSREL